MSAGTVANGVAADVVSDVKKPRRKLGSRLVAFPRSKDPKKNILRQVLSQIAIVSPRLHQPNHATLVLVDQLFISRRVIVPDAKHQLRVGIQRRWSR
jgi:hypothetical protein